MPVNINGESFKFSAGKHNELQKAIIEEFAPRFAPNSECLYVGDTIEKDLVKNVEKLKELGFEITLHDKMPDVVLYRKDKDANEIYFLIAYIPIIVFWFLDAYYLLQERLFRSLYGKVRRLSEEKIDFDMNIAKNEFKSEKNTFCACMISVTEAGFYIPLSIVTTAVIILTHTV